MYHVVPPLGTINALTWCCFLWQNLSQHEVSPYGCCSYVVQRAWRSLYIYRIIQIHMYIVGMHIWHTQKHIQNHRNPVSLQTTGPPGHSHDPQSHRSQWFTSFPWPAEARQWFEERSLRPPMVSPVRPPDHLSWLEDCNGKLWLMTDKQKKHCFFFGCVVLHRNFFLATLEISRWSLKRCLHLFVAFIPLLRIYIYIH